MTQDQIGMLTAIKAYKGTDCNLWKVFTDTLEEAGETDLANYLRYQVELQLCPCPATCRCEQCFNMEHTAMDMRPDLHERLMEIAEYLGRKWL